MYTYYIQYTTDFHLLAALAAIDDLFDVKIILIGPETSLIPLLNKQLDFIHYKANPRNPNVNLIRLISRYIFSRKQESVVLVTPFIYPFFTINLLLDHKIRPYKIIRTDEGVGTYASVFHFYNAYKNELKGSSKWKCLIKAFLKKCTLTLTNLLRVCENRYIFDSELKYDLDHVNKIIRNINLMRKVGRFDGQLIFVTQPGLEQNFSTPSSYAEFIYELGKMLNCDFVYVKKHPVDKFDYRSYGLSMMDNLPLELFEITNSTVVGFSSTALLTAKLFCSPKEVYFMDLKEGCLTIDMLSKFNQSLFKHYLQPLTMIKKS